MVTRHPEYETVIEVYGMAEPRIISIDMGKSFDVTMLTEGVENDVLEWAEGLREQVADLAADHPARQSVEATIEDVLSQLPNQADLATLRKMDGA